MRKIVVGALSALSLIAMSCLAQAQTFTWSGPSSFNDGQTTWSAITATNLNINGNARFDDNSLFSNSVYSISLLLNGGGVRTIFSGTADPTSFNAAAFNNLSFVAASIVGIRFESNPDGFIFNNFSGFSGTQFVFSNTAVAVPGPMVGAGIPALLMLGGLFGFRRWQARTTAAA